MKKAKLYYFFLFAAILLLASAQGYAQAPADSTAGHSQKIDSTGAAVKPMPPPLNGSATMAKDSIKGLRDSSALAKTDSSGKKHKVFQPNPKRAGLYSAIFPGLGQLYNRQYWKVPVVYAILGVAGYFIVTNQSKYQEYRKAYIGRQTNDLTSETDNTLLYSLDQLKTLQDGYKRYLDITVLLTGVGYTLQILDAVVFAHLKNFDISRDISMRMKPLAMPNGSAGVGLVFNIKPRLSQNISKGLLSPF